MAPLTDYERGLIVGVLVSAGSFGGDGKQPQVTLRMHVRHESLLHWLAERVPGSRVYGPYHHGGRSYAQWMVRGRALLDELLPLLEAELNPQLDSHAAMRLEEMTERYAGFIRRERGRQGDAAA
jgi:hypothetical protein